MIDSFVTLALGITLSFLTLAVTALCICFIVKLFKSKDL